MVIVEAQTGVTYQQQCGGYATIQHTIEGFIIPVGGTSEAQRIYDWFWETFQGHCYPSLRRNPWTADTLQQLQKMVSEIPCWHCTQEGEDQSSYLQLDLERMEECMEAWIPVHTAYGRGVLILENSD